MQTHEPAVGAGAETFPPAPWQLRGVGFQTVHPIPLAAALPFMPRGAQLVPLWPGVTLATVYVAAYAQGSTLRYHEAIIAVGVVRVGGRLGFALPRVYVDEPRSLAGGQALWGLPKELATFRRERQGTERVIRVAREGAEVLSLRVGRARGAVPLGLPLPAFGVRGAETVYFVGRLRARVGLVRAQVVLPPHSPLASVPLDRPTVGLAYTALDLCVPAPRSARGRARAGPLRHRSERML
jgi:hypothetical protein